MASVLIVEDERLVARMLETFLRAANLEPRVTHSGADAWDMLCSDETPLVALIDWQLPHISGPELCRKVRERVDLPFVYLIMMTGRISQRDVSSGSLDFGAHEYIAKPFEVDAVVERTRLGLVTAQARRRNSSSPQRP
jgi:DNA-binding response OmpR family regulator